MKADEGKIKEILEKGTAEVIERAHLEQALRSGRKLKVKFGIDPTAPDLHLGHMVLLRKLRQFQDLGHLAILIIGDFTARIGDPSGKETARKPLKEAEIKQNTKKYLNQAGKIIDIKKAKILHNSRWLCDASLPITLSAKVSVQQVLEREDFQKRLSAHQSITMLELLYPLFQGYDSVAVNADVEIGGNDQKFNLIAGRKIQRAFNIPEQDILTAPLLVGTDGVKKMSKSAGNYIALDEKPNEMFSKIMMVPDKEVDNYFSLLTDIMPQAQNIKPMEAKKNLAWEIVKNFYGEKEANKAKEYFEKTFSKKETPEDLKNYKVKAGESWINFLLGNKFAFSRTGAKRLLSGGAIELDGVKVVWAGEKITKSGVAKIGKYKYIKIEV
ncbi:tyrosine--tRNA ligase [Candidatus Giovannonibacteria bacterium RIFCSPHIGHO2_01_FULL_45_33]|uniref:Tyrosine--tRNA ligase n=1 Tax=Candidatus Giovannonibacteria bacterium RIFCSPLOWO2_01_FULL_45_34 TaxID=1798351 RepID=A0A1F5WZ82_9BACT|nr:MAG: tyrosine--tRNA ligase [Candidatus Giovannonibacteria bacterium RIFCSPHIGHO2_01_FULL_45_33]OGF69402.1 MAG: tyrosine--tRNA ligase [Candidatus Giovannonibacteria bacterium RIFCSPHIGHO2_02_FULL_44_11]OGF80929.1 MAG: tyrosine--tRNA ligase [Candidatus Giovannonibacteria bacterium RIFCSPLOWO2_01_FULL_45_34]